MWLPIRGAVTIDVSAFPLSHEPPAGSARPKNQSISAHPSAVGRASDAQTLLHEAMHMRQLPQRGIRSCIRA